MTVLDNPATEGSLLQTRLVRNPAVSVIRSTDDEIVAYLGSRSRSTHRIADGEGRGLLADFVTAFDTPATPAEIADSVGLAEDAAEEFAGHLRDGKVLISQDEARYSYLISGLGLTPTEADLAVRVVGQGAIATAVARQLGDLLGTRIEPIGDVQEAFEGADFVVLACDRLSVGLCYDADELSRVHDTAWQLVYLDGFEVMIGPTFVPGVSINYYDFDAMDEASRVLRTQYLYEKSAVPADDTGPVVPAFVADLAGAWASAAIAQHLWGRGSFLEGYVMRVDLERMQIIRDRVLRLPRNPVDMGIRNDLRHPFL